MAFSLAENTSLKLDDKKASIVEYGKVFEELAGVDSLACEASPSFGSGHEAGDSAFEAGGAQWASGAIGPIGLMGRMGRRR
jgi:hypothetical protein